MKRPNIIIPKAQAESGSTVLSAEAVAAGRSLIPSAKKRYGSTKVTTPSAMREKIKIKGAFAVCSTMPSGFETASAVSIIKNEP